MITSTRAQGQTSLFNISDTEDIESCATVSTSKQKEKLVQYEETAKAIRIVRKKMGLDQETFAVTIANVGKNTVSRWERGKTKPDDLRLMWIKSNLPRDMAAMLVNLKAFGTRGNFDKHQFNIRDNSEDDRESTSK